MKIKLGHSPDSDDAFMFWGLASGAVQSDHEFEHILRDIQTLNEWALEGKLESSAVSVHTYAHLTDKYALLRHGGSFGDNYGPMLVAPEAIAIEELPNHTIAVPGKLTSAYLELQIWWHETFGSLDELKVDIVAFDEIIPAIHEGRFRVGLIIHEGQLTYKRENLELILDLGVWWKSTTGLPLPLGVNVVRRDLGEEIVQDVSRCMRESITAGLDNRNLALQYALQFARGMDTETSDTFVGMYVNERTKDMGDEGVRAIRLLLERGHMIGLVPAPEIVVVD